MIVLSKVLSSNKSLLPVIRKFELASYKIKKILLALFFHLPPQFLEVAKCNFILLARLFFSIFFTGRFSFGSNSILLSVAFRIGTSESIRKCSPRIVDEWREYYFANVKPQEHIIELGKKLYTKITEVIQSEVTEVTEHDCIDYMVQLVIDRTYDGYVTEIQTVYGQLQKILDVKIESAPDEWDEALRREVSSY